MRLLLDADALIKLNRAGVLLLIAETFECVIPDEVYREAVINGKKRGYPDAEEIDKVIEAGMEVISVAPVPRRYAGLDAGESAVLSLVSREETQVVVSDDRQFVNLLSRAGIPYLVPAALIVAMAQQQILTKTGARDALDRMRPWIRDSSYMEALQGLEKLETL